MFFRSKLFLRSVATTALFTIVSELVLPFTASALTSGPSQPEFSSFEPVATTNMVNQFSGDFTYNLPVLNIPGPNGGGYAMSLSYHSGPSMEEEASWVGLGWTLNPGAINRSKLGVPDDFSGQEVNHINDVPDNITVSAAFNGNLDLFSNGLGLSAGRTITYNNFKGYGASNNLGLSVLGGTASVGYGFSPDGSSSFTYDINPAAYFAYQKDKGPKKTRAAEEKRAKSDPAYKAELLTRRKAEKEKQAKESSAPASKKEKMAARASAVLSRGSAYLDSRLADDFRPITVAEYEGYSANASVSLGLAPSQLEIAIRVGISGNVTMQRTHNTTENVYGYMYSQDAGDKGTLDYSLERENAFVKRNKFLSIPYASADMFAVTGEGLGGSFRLRNRFVGEFRPRRVQNLTQRFNLGIDPQLGFNIGIGSRIGNDVQVSDMGKGYHLPGFDFRGEGSDDEPYYFRFAGDLGSNIKHTDTDEARKVQKNSLFEDPYFDGTQSSIPNRVPRTSYVGCHTLSELQADPSLAYEKDAQIAAWRQPTGYGGNDGKLIGEMVQYNEDGNRYVYGLPLYNSNEESMSYNMPYCADNAGSNTITGDIGVARSTIGEKTGNSYASSYLLTQINTSDYIDRTFDGATDDDFGGWTKFAYETITKNAGQKKFRWRMPYKGLTYGRNSISDVRDDQVSYRSGDKDIYYVKSIETKTHIALFYTADREDGKPANSDNKAAGLGNGCSDCGNKLKKLTKIELYLKSTDPGKANKKIKVVNFEYFNDSEALCKNVPNGTGTGGKLTLKKVWFEYMDVTNSKISPYVFSYEYKTFGATSPLKTKYPAITSFGQGLNQNPNYNSDVLDVWGNYAYLGAERNAQMMPWTYQGIIPANDTYDPAAWNLKTITLPTGGQILVQYEQHQYAYVQDQPAMGMISLGAATSESNSETVNIDLAAVGLDATATQADIDAYRQKLTTFLASNKVYIKFLYALKGGSPDVNRCNSEFITGYLNATVNQAVTGRQIQIKFTGSNYYLPHQVCKDYYIKNKAYIVDGGGGCQELEVYDISNVIGALRKAFGKMANNFNTDKSNSCAVFNPSKSYLKLPLPKAKRGGGIRVKRIMMYDPGLQGGSENLYGSEYLYENEDGSCSGVATNETAADREENPLVNFMKTRADQSLYGKLISGEDKEQSEGPLGEQLLPNASIGYSRVVVKNIHSGATTPGFNVYEYYTSKDFPFDKGVDNTSLDFRQEIPGQSISIGNVSIVVDHQAAYQGYSFVMNDMHGKQKRVATYGGLYTSGQREDGYPKSSEEIYEYYKPGEKVKVLNPITGATQDDYLGREEELIMETRKVSDYTLGISVQFNISLGLVTGPPFVIPQFAAAGYVNMADKSIHTYVTNKIINYPAIQKRVTTYKDGMLHVKENRLFDPVNGDVLASVSSDIYTGASGSLANAASYTEYNMPGHYIYSGFGGKYQTEDYCAKGGFSVSGPVSGRYSVTVSGASKDKFTKGDLIRLKYGSTYGYGHIDEIVDGSPLILKVYDAGKRSSTDQPIGNNLQTGSGSEVLVAASGYQNKTRIPVGSVTLYNKHTLGNFTENIEGPFKTSGGLLQKKQADFTNGSNSYVVNAKANTFKDCWSFNQYIIDTYFPSGKPQNPYLTGESGKLRQQTSYEFKGQAYVPTKAYEAPVYTSFTGFDFTNTTAQAGWLPVNTATYYSPNGEALEEVNILGVASSAQFGYGENVPVVIAKNAKVSAIRFAGFDDLNTDAEVIESTSAGEAHSGKKFLKVIPGTPNTTLSKLKVSIDAQIQSKGLSVRFWAKLPAKYDQEDLKAMGIKLKTAATSSVDIQTVSPEVLARSGAWTLIEANFTNLPAVTDPVCVSLSASTIVYIDDFRMQPKDASLSCYVYDSSTLKLLASFDDQHFGLLYQYNTEGKLIRKQIETERGVKTITETLYNTPLADR